jgi:hypothetical protein
MKKAKHSKLELRTQTLRPLTSQDLAGVAGGWIRRPITWSCPQPTQHGSCYCPPPEDE